MDRGGEGEGRVPVRGMRVRRDRVPVAAGVSDVSRHRVGTRAVAAVHASRLTDERLDRPERRSTAGRPPTAPGRGVIYDSAVRRGVRLALQAAAVALLAALIDGQRPAAPNFSLPQLDGRGDIALRSLRGKVVVLNFWASWCPPCQEEAPLFNQIQGTYRRRGVAVVGVDSQDFANDARA